MIRNFFAPPPHQPRLPEEQVRRLYPRYRLDILTTTYLGYAFFYLVRNNLSPVAKDMEHVLAYDKAMVSNILAATAISYGVGKFLMGSLSDRSDPRKFMALGLLMTALVNFAFGAVANYYVHVALWSLNGLIQGMGWPPCGRAIGHWFSVRERGTIFSVWNTATNVGGGLAGVVAAKAAGTWGWQAAFYFPAMIAALGAAFLFWRLRDTPQSVGLPSIEEHTNDFTEEERRTGTHERELTTRELFIDNILKNRLLWIVAVANFFVYVIRYCLIDWGPTYLREMKGATLSDGGYAILLLEYAGIPSTLLMGWFSDKVGGRRGMVSLLCVLPIPAAFFVLGANPGGRLCLDMLMFGAVGLLTYPPVMLLALAGLDLTSKKAVGTAAGFIGLAGYLGRTVEAKVVGTLAERYDWDVAFDTVFACMIAAIVLLALTWKVRPRA